MIICMPSRNRTRHFLSKILAPFRVQGACRLADVVQPQLIQALDGCPATPGYESWRGCPACPSSPGLPRHSSPSYIPTDAAPSAASRSPSRRNTVLSPARSLGICHRTSLQSSRSLHTGRSCSERPVRRTPPGVDIEEPASGSLKKSTRQLTGPSTSTRCGASG